MCVFVTLIVFGCLCIFVGIGIGEKEKECVHIKMKISLSCIYLPFQSHSNIPPLLPRVPQFAFLKYIRQNCLSTFEKACR